MDTTDHYYEDDEFDFMKGWKPAGEYLKDNFTDAVKYNEDDDPWEGDLYAELEFLNKHILLDEVSELLNKD